MNPNTTAQMHHHQAADKEPSMWTKYVEAGKHLKHAEPSRPQLKDTKLKGSK